MTRLASIIIVLGLLTGCRNGGFIAKDTPEWGRAVERARAAGKLDPDCVDDGVVYVILEDKDWDSDPGDGGHTDGSLVSVRKGGIKGYSESFILEHEFLHCMLECSGEGDIQNAGHWDQAWDGLRPDGS